MSIHKIGIIIKVLNISDQYLIREDIYSDPVTDKHHLLRSDSEGERETYNVCWVQLQVSVCEHTDGLEDIQAQLMNCRAENLHTFDFHLPLHYVTVTSDLHQSYPQSPTHHLLSLLTWPVAVAALLQFTTYTYQ